MRKITTDLLFDLLRHETNGKFFSVTFQRRTTRHNRTQVAGDERTMLCRTGMKKYKLGVVSDESRDEEDFRCAVLTVWSVSDFMRLTKTGIDKLTAGFNAWRRIDLCSVLECSLVDDKELPPEIIDGLHEITNTYRLANMPRIKGRP